MSMSVSIAESVLEVYKRVRSGTAAWAVFAIENQESLEAIYVVPSGIDHEDIECPESGNVIWDGLVDWIAKNMVDSACFIVVRMKSANHDFSDAKLGFISWCPQGLKRKIKMFHQSHLTFVKDCFEGVESQPVHAECLEELDRATISSAFGL